MEKDCSSCGDKLIWENPYIAGMFHSSSSNIEGFEMCKDCLVEHCCSTDCEKCEIGSYPGCEHLELKIYYM